MRSPEPRTQQPEELDLGDDFDLRVLVQIGEPAVELVRRRDFPYPGSIAFRL
jgi:hypothetical protein